ncbi:SAV_915 family protein [Actinomadura sp. 7K507]|uniref:SAV_915 family protein n=1 Tax=Actinomadura sp. 7K507 TaxID=2530365 RepID=UPI00104C3921|nr:SAV_915 family protein [Actinomadura sp. 7K507]TDC93062.1 hypothetical protein E1285_10550 [Actinomadura sp. 7K507]
MPADKPDEKDRAYGDQGWFESDAEVAPEVITGGSDEQVLGETAFVPTEVELSPGDENAMVKLVNTVDGELATLAYSSLEDLVRCCGEKQPWVAFRTENIDELPGVAGADVLLWNEELPMELRRDTGNGDASSDSDQGRDAPRREP